jgi:hypothetical protein
MTPLAATTFSTAIINSPQLQSKKNRQSSLAGSETACLIAFTI